MGGVDNGLTLEGLAQRLEALEHENARLRDEVATFRGSDTGRDGVGGVLLRTPSASRAENEAEDGGGQATEVPEKRMDRRRLLKGAAAAAASLVVAGSLTQRDIREAKAAELYGEAATANGTGVVGVSGEGIGVDGLSSRGIGVRGHTGLLGTATVGVLGQNNSGDGGPGVKGESLVGPGVVGNGATIQPEDPSQYDGGHGVVGNGTGAGHGVVGDGGYGGRSNGGLPGTGVLGRNILLAPRDAADFGGINHEPLGVGVKGEGTLSGVEGHAMGEGFDNIFKESAVPAAGGVGVRGRDTNVNSGVGVQGESPSLGVKGTSPRVGVSGEGPSDGSITHIAVRGLSPNGLGGVFGGGRAQLKLNPNAATGRPTTGAHQGGELFMNSAAELFICTRSGGPGTWRKVQTVPA